MLRRPAAFPSCRRRTGHDRGRARARGRAAAASGPATGQRRAQRGGRVTWPAPAGDRQPGGDDRSLVRPRPPAADACPDGRRLAPRIPRRRVPAGRCRSGGRDAALSRSREDSVNARTSGAPPGHNQHPAAPIGQRLCPAPGVPARPGSAFAPATACPDRQNPHRADRRRGTNPDHAAARGSCAEPSTAPSPGRGQAHPAARTTPRPASRPGPARAPASLVSGRKGGGRMTAHDSAGPHASFVPPRPVLLLRYPPGPPSPRLSAGPGLGRRGAADAGGWRPCSRSAHRDGEPLQARPAEAGRSPEQRSITTARAADQAGRPGSSPIR